MGPDLTGGALQPARFIIRKISPPRPTSFHSEAASSSRISTTARSIEVDVIDRGPFKKGRKIDLSHKAAHIIGMLDKGTAPVRISLISAPPGAPAVGAPLRYFVQVGSFSREDNAERLRDRLTAYYRDVHVDRLEADQRHYYRVRMGAFATRPEAESRAKDSARFGLPIIIVPE